ncbi:MAG: YIP1 family protein [Candidatus Aenigmarchaeota archaeon]|nr:YIP1 family protein [Candidatus Aenigmarchaeota archaeon]
MLDDVRSVLKRLLLNPEEVFSSGSPILSHSIRYYLTLQFLPTGLLSSYAMMYLLGISEFYPEWYATIMVGVFFNFISLAFYSILLHIVIAMMGGNGGFYSTIMINVLSLSFYLILGFVPLVNVAAMAYGVYVQFIGVRSRHGLSKRAAVFAIAFSSISFVFLPYSIAYYL